MLIQQHRAITFLIFCIAALAIRAEAATPKIFSTVVNSSNNQITITGQDFSPAGLVPTVVLATSNLVVKSFSNRSVKATLPSGYSPGSYSLTVTNSNGQSAAFEV